MTSEEREALLAALAIIFADLRRLQISADARVRLSRRPSSQDDLNWQSFPVNTEAVREVLEKQEA